MSPRLKQFAAINSRLLLILAIIVLAAGGALFVRSRQHVDYRLQTACSLLSTQIAHKVGGQQLQPLRRAPVTDKDFQTTYCVYIQPNKKAVSLVIRSPKTAHGAALNRQAFSEPAVSNQKVYGFGDMAFWAPTFGQLHILKHNTWFILSAGPTTPTSRTLAQSEALASALANRL